MDCTAWPRLHLPEIAWELILFPMCPRFKNRSGGYVPCILRIIILWGRKTSCSAYSIIQLCDYVWLCVNIGTVCMVLLYLRVRGVISVFNWALPGIELRTKSHHEQNALPSHEVMQMEQNDEALNSEHTLSLGVKINDLTRVCSYSCYLHGRVS